MTSYRLLKILFVILLLITFGEFGYYVYIQREKFIRLDKSTSVASEVNISTTPISLQESIEQPLDLPTDQSYRLPDAPNRLTKFLTRALYDLISELTKYEATKTLNLKVSTLYEGKVTEVYQGKEAQKIHPPDPAHPKRTVVMIISIADTDQSEPVTIRLVESELPYLTITDQQGKKVSPGDIKGKQVKYNRTIEFPLKKTDDIVTYSPLVYDQVTVLNQ